MILNKIKAKIKLMKHTQPLVYAGSKYYKAHELVDRDTYDRYQNRLWRIWQIFNPGIIYTMDKIRERYDQPGYINTWMWNGSTQYAGFRPRNYTVYGELSQHNFGNAVDIKMQDVSAEQIRNDILSDIWHEDFKYITCIESEVPWLHVDCRNWDKVKHGILVVPPPERK